jgi:hypothetical protein
LQTGLPESPLNLQPALTIRVFDESGQVRRAKCGGGSATASVSGTGDSRVEGFIIGLGDALNLLSFPGCGVLDRLLLDIFSFSKNFGTKAMMPNVLTLAANCKLYERSRCKLAT